MEFSVRGETFRSGFVDDVIPGSSLILPATAGVDRLELFDAALGYEPRLESKLVSPLRRATQKSSGRKRTHMKKRSTVISVALTESRSRTGHHCPASGWWIPIGGTGPARFVAEGELMPSENGEQMVWKSIAAASVSALVEK